MFHILVRGSKFTGEVLFDVGRIGRLLGASRLTWLDDVDCSSIGIVALWLTWRRRYSTAWRVLGFLVKISLASWSGCLDVQWCYTVAVMVVASLESRITELLFALPSTLNRALRVLAYSNINFCNPIPPIFAVDELLSPAYLLWQDDETGVEFVTTDSEVGFVASSMYPWYAVVD